MVSLNLTIVVEFTLFLVFYLVSRRYILAPLHRLIIERQERVRRDEEQARQLQQESERLGQAQAELLARAQAEASTRLRDARFSAYRQNRIEADERRRQADAEVAAFHGRVLAELEHERRRYPEVLPDLVEAVDRQINIEGSLL